MVEGQGGSGGEASGASDSVAPEEAPADEAPADEPEPLLCSQWNLGYDHRLESEVECGSCGCFGVDRSLCREGDCLAPRTIRRCTEADDITQAATVGVSRIVGTTWSFNIKGPGGCGGGDFDVCYEPRSDEGEYPRYVPIFALALTSADECDRMAFQRMEVDLSPLAEVANGALVDTIYGMMAVGELTCVDRTLLAGSSFGREVDNADRRCVVDADCVPVDVSVSCSPGCHFTAIRKDNLPGLIENAERIDRDVCASHEAECAGIFATPIPCEEAGARCRSGLCQYTKRP